MASVKHMKWRAVYKDGTERKEDIDSFDELDKDNIKFFILEGLNTSFTHSTETGDVVMTNNTLNFILDDMRIGKSKDVINYKEKLKMAIGDTGREKDIIGYYTGWKESNDRYKNIEVLLWVDMLRQQIKLRLRLTPIKDLYGEFDLIINGITKTTQLEFNNLDTRHEFVIELFDQNAK